MWIHNLEIWCKEWERRLRLLGAGCSALPEDGAESKVVEDVGRDLGPMLALRGAFRTRPACSHLYGGDRGALLAPSWGTGAARFGMD